MAKKVRQAKGKPADRIRPGNHSLNPDRAKSSKDTHSNMRDKSTINRLLMYKNFKAKRNPRGKVVKAAPFQTTVASGTVARVAPNRNWFGNTRVIGQQALQKFQENLGRVMKDPYQVVMRQTKLPITLISEKAKKARVHVLDTESFEHTFGTKAQRKKPNLQENLTWSESETVETDSHLETNSIEFAGETSHSKISEIPTTSDTTVVVSHIPNTTAEYSPSSGVVVTVARVQSLGNTVTSLPPMPPLTMLPDQRKKMELQVRKKRILQMAGEQTTEEDRRYLEQKKRRTDSGSHLNVSSAPPIEDIERSRGSNVGGTKGVKNELRFLNNRLDEVSQRQDALEKRLYAFETSVCGRLGSLETALRALIGNSNR